MTKFRKNMLLALGAQAVALGVGLIKALVLPAAMSVDGFAYWQVYVLYAGFVGVCAFGYTDGVYLLYGGQDYEDLPFERLRGANRVYCFVLAIVSIVFGCCAMLADDALRTFAFVFVAAEIFVLCLSGLCTYILQVTNQFKRYSFCTVIDKIIFLAVAVCLTIMGFTDFRIFIVVDFVTKLVALVFFVWFCRGVLFGHAIAFTFSIREAYSYARVGISLLFANFSSMLISNLGRFFIDWLGDLASYAYYSFGNSATNLVLTFVTAISAVLYPKLKRVPEENLDAYYLRIDRVMTPITAVGLLMYFPAFWLVDIFYVKYAPMLVYLNIMFVSSIYQAKMGILVNTYYKTLRMERRMLIANAKCVAIFAMMAGISFYLTRDVWWIAMSTAVTAALRCLLSEREIRSALNIKASKSVVFQNLFVVLFLGLTLMLQPFQALCFLVVIFCCVMVIEIVCERNGL